MKKLALTLAIVLGLSMTTFAEGGGLPNHGGDENADAPLGTGIAVLTALGAAYLVGKRRKED